MKRAEEMRWFRGKLEVAIEETIRSKKPRILLLGPRMDGNDDGSVLRKRLKERLWKDGLPILAEHNEMKKAAKSKLKGLNNLSRLELHIAHEVELVVIIPASPGSFAELGLFAQQSRICPKMVILLDKNKCDGKSYIELGPKKQARELKADIVPVDYQNVDKVLEKVAKFIDRAQHQMADLG